MEVCQMIDSRGGRQEYQFKIESNSEIQRQLCHLSNCTE